MTSERLADIEARLERDGRVVAAELARIYATSEDTVRRDLRALAAEGRCRRVYGGALPATPSRGTVSARARLAPAAKAALGAALARLVEPGMTVFIDAGSTTLACAERLQVRGDGGDARAGHRGRAGRERGRAARHPRRAGRPAGRRRPRAAVLAAVEAIRPDLLLLGACGIDAEAGITAHSLDDAAVKRAVAARAGRVAVAADRRKLGTAAPFAVMDLAACDILCLEATTPDEQRQRLAALRAGDHRRGDLT